MFLGLIPARGGSKGIPRKNIAPCAGKPLLWYTCEAALKSTALSRVVLSTDDAEIGALGQTFGVEVPYLRPAKIAGDETPSIAVIQNIIKWLDADKSEIDAIVLLQPTSPLRTSRNIDEACALYRASGAKTVVSVTPIPHRYHPQSLMRIEDGLALPYQGGRIVPQRRQDLMPLYARNGPAILICSTEVLRGGSLYGEPTFAYVMEEEQSIDIDTPYDLAVAESLLSRREQEYSNE